MVAKRPPPSARPLADRLQLKGATLLTLGVPATVAPHLTSVKQSAKVPKQVTAVMLFARDAAELDAVMTRLEGKWSEDPLIWVCYPKGTSGVTTDLNRDRLWELLAPRALRPVAQIAVDEVWSALRFRRS
jgi:hypothetical protein